MNTTILHGDNNGRPGTLTVNETEAVATVQSLVRDGLRNEVWASAELADGRTYRARNVHGKVIGGYTR